MLGLVCGLEWQGSLAAGLLQVEQSITPLSMLRSDQWYQHAHRMKSTA